MNKEKILELANFIEKSDSFSMHHVYWHPHSTDTYKGDIKNTKAECPACILGHLRVMEGLSPSTGELGSEKIFELSRQKVAEIVTPNSSVAYFSARPGDSNYISKDMAVSMLRNLAETGEVEWRAEH